MYITLQYAGICYVALLASAENGVRFIAIKRCFARFTGFVNAMLFPIIFARREKYATS